jgi:hypothetical protein
MTVTISRLYDSYTAALEAVRNLESAGVPHSDISIVSNNSENWYSSETSTTRDRAPSRNDIVDRDHDGRDDRVEGAEAGAGIGGAAGGVIGLLTGLGLMAIPGVGPVVAAGWLIDGGRSCCGWRSGRPPWRIDASWGKQRRRLCVR